MGKKKSGKGKKEQQAPKETPASGSASVNGTPRVAKPESDQYPDEPTPLAPPPKSPPDAEPTPINADPPTGSSERRIFRRVPFFRKIQYKFESLDAFRAEYANDISIGGMFIKTDAPEPVGSVIFLEFDLKDGSKILSGYGKVVRVNPTGVPDFDPGMGVEFLKFDEESMIRIKSLVKDRFGRG